MSKLRLVKSREGFSLMEVLMAMTIFVVIFGAVMEALAANNNLRRQSNDRLRMWSESESMLNYLSDAISKGRVDKINMNEAQEEYKGYNYIQWTPYEHNASGEIEYDDPEEMNITNLQNMFEHLDTTWRGTTDHLPDKIAPGVTLDKDNLPGFYAIMDETNFILYLGLSLTANPNGEDVTVTYTSEIVLRRDLHE